MGELDTWKHCPRCGAGVAPLAGGARIECGTCGLRHYASAKPTASALVVDGGGRVLLARRAHAPDQGKWDLPGGFLDEHEDPRDALRRELAEETGLEVEQLAFFDVLVDRYGDAPDAKSTLNLYWTCRVAAGQPRPADDVAELAWFGRDELPDASRLAFRNNAQILAAWRSRNEHA